MKKINFNHDWTFTQEGTERFEAVTLPHDAMINTERNPQMRNYFLLAGFEGGKYIYTKTFHVPEEYTRNTLILEFEAVYCMSRVYVNGELASEKAYGFTPFQITLNPYLKFGGDNEIRVEVNVPKEGHGRWYTGGGIYRPVNLYIGDENYIALYGLKVTTLGIHPARIRVDVEVCGAGQVSVDIRKDGKTVASGKGEAENSKMSLQLTISEAKLWSADTPELYQAVVTLAQGERIYDKVTESFGIRTVEVNPEKGLLINGIPTFLRGGCIHNDNGVIGVINNDATELHRAKILKKSGFNALRSAHHPMSRSLMKACDEVGLYVMDEAFDYWYRPKGGNPHCGLFLDTFREDTEAMVQDAYNHPCVVIYSIGNEIPEAGSMKGVRVGKAIVDTIHSIDTTRPTTLCPSVHWLREYLDGMPYLTRDEDEWMAESPENKEKDWKHYMKIFMGAAANIPEDEKDMPYPTTLVQMDEDATKNLYPYLDIAGYNYYEDKYDTLHKLHPERVLLGTETRGEKIVDTMRYAREHSFLIGDFIWTLQEHLGEANCCNISYGMKNGEKSNLSGKDYPWLINYGGTIDLIGTILPSIHKYEFAWDEDKKGLYLASQPPIHEGLVPNVNGYRWTDTVDGWTYEGYEGKPTWVDAYTDASEIEIFVNGASAGRSVVKDYYAKVPCIYKPGELVGVGYDESGKEIYRTVVRTASRDARITAVPDKTVLRAGEEDFCFIDVSITDSKGAIKLLPERKVVIKIEGAGTVQGFGSANHLNEEKYNQAYHTTYLGRLQAVIRSGKTGGEVKVTFSSEGMGDTVIRLQVAEETGAEGAEGVHAYHSFLPGRPWLDTNGRRIQAHGGSVLYQDGIYYWYGENKEKTTGHNGIWHWGVRCYTSIDLYNWEDKGLIIPPEPDDPSSSLHPASMMDRPHIIYNRNTKKYVCWLKIMNRDGSQTETVLTADNILGPYTKVREGLKPLNMSAGDFDLVVAPDGKAYYYFERVHSETICADLTPDYTDVTGYYSTHFPHISPPYVREATAHFIRRGKHYLVTSGTTGYLPNPSEVAIADTWHGPYTVLGNPHPGDESNTSYHSQISSVFKVEGKKDLYIAVADRWVPDQMELKYEEYAAEYERMFAPGYDGAEEFVRRFGSDAERNTFIADYVWLPFRFDGDMAYLDWMDEWRIEDYE